MDLKIDSKFLKNIGGLREGVDGSQDHDLVLRTGLNTSNIRQDHLRERYPKTFYRTYCG